MRKRDSKTICTAMFLNELQHGFKLNLLVENFVRIVETVKVLLEILQGHTPWSCWRIASY